MATIVPINKACAENPLKSSTPLGAALAYMGIQGAVPLFHGSQGCTSFALVLAVRHFKEAIPLQTTAMDEPATILGGADNLEEALVNVATRMKPAFIGVASTALVETRGEDIAGELKRIVAKRRELDATTVVFASTPDFEGALEDGWAAAVTATITEVCTPTVATSTSDKLVFLPGVHETAGTLEELRRLAHDFGLVPIIFPDVGQSLDGYVPDTYIGTSLGGTTTPDLALLGDAKHVIAIGEHMRAPAEALHAKSGVPYTVLPSLLGINSSDQLVSLLSVLSARPPSSRLKRERSQLVDAMLDAHFHFSGKRVAIGADPDLLCSLTDLMIEMGALVVVAVSSTKNNPRLNGLPIDTIHVGDLSDLESLAKHHDAELLLTHSHGRMAAEELGVPLFRIGFPIFDQLGHQHRSLGGYAGSRDLVFAIANVFQRQIHEPRPEDFAAPLAVEDSRHACA